jgi:hypothetical protein
MAGAGGPGSALNGAPHKLATVAQFFVGGAVTSVSRGALAEGAAAP